MPHKPTVEFIPGPPTTEMTRTAAETALQRHPLIREGASYALEQHQGHWIASIIHQAAPPFGGGGDDEAPTPDVSKPDDLGGDGGPPSDDGGDSDGPPKKEKGGSDALLHQVMDALTQIGAALGVPIGVGDSPIPGADAAPAPPGPGGPPPGPPGGGPDVKMHERAMKPGETPPGGTPLGAPAFASVRADHPWAHLAGKVASFKVADQIGETPIVEVLDELTSLAKEIGYSAKVREARDADGNRIAEGLITAHR